MYIVLITTNTLAKLKVAAAGSKAKEREGEKERGQNQEKQTKTVFLHVCPMYQKLDHNTQGRRLNDNQQSSQSQSKKLQGFCRTITIMIGLLFETGPHFSFLQIEAETQTHIHTAYRFIEHTLNVHI